MHAILINEMNKQPKEVSRIQTPLAVAMGQSLTRFEMFSDFEIRDLNARRQSMPPQNDTTFVAYNVT